MLGWWTVTVSDPIESGAARDAGVARVRALTRAAVVGAALLAGGFAGLAAASTHVRKAARVRNASPARARTVTAVPMPVPAHAPSSAQVPAPAAPAQPPAQSSAPPVVSSGGS
jgi:hypothetical protein